MTSVSPKKSDYRFVCELARGGMGRVDLVLRQDGDFTRLYARKRLLRSLEEDPSVRTMFADEARIAGMLRHPNVVSVLDAGEDDEGMYLVMDYVEGISLTRLVREANRQGVVIPLQVILRILIQVADGLHAAHELTAYDGTPLGLVHRDVSPHNILIERNGVVRVSDFGIAKALGRRSRTSTGLLKGKTGYLAPEVLRFEDPDRRSDLYSLGVVLYELATGSRLYGGGDLAQVARRILNEPPPDLGDDRRDAPAELVALAFRLLAKQPDLRPQNAREVSRELQDILGELLAVEEPLLLEEFLQDYLNANELDERRRLADKVSRSVGGWSPPESAGPAESAPTATHTFAARLRSPLGLGLLVLSALLGAGAAAGITWSVARSDDPSSTEDEAVDTGPAAAEAADDPEPDLRETAAARLEPAVEPPPEASEIETPEPREEPTSESRRSRRRPRPETMQTVPAPDMSSRRTFEPWDPE